MQEFHVGVKQIDITPPVGIEMAGFAGRGNSTGIRAPLTATIVVLGCLDDTSGRIIPQQVLMTLDLVVLFQEISNRIRVRLANDLNLQPNHPNSKPEDAVMLLNVHNHYGPLTMEGFGEIGPRVQTYLDELEEKLIQATISASQAMRPAVMRTAKGKTLIGINRRERTSDGRIVIGNNPNKPIDRDLLCVELASSTPGAPPICLLINATCHPVSQERGVCEFSADYLSPFREDLELAFTCPIGFIQGACGDINPVEMGNSYATAERLGHQLADETQTILRQLEPASACPLDIRATVLELPARQVVSIEAAQADVREYKALVQQARDERQPRTTIAWWELNLQWAEKRLFHITKGEPLPAIKCLIQVFRIGDVAIASSQGELFNDIGSTVKERSPFPVTVVAAYNGDTIGYVPTAEAFDEGGYEVETSLVGPRAAEMIQNEMIRLLHELHGQTRSS